MRLMISMLENGSNYICWPVILIASLLKKVENYYLQVLLKECKYIEKKVIKSITDDLKFSTGKSDESDEE